MLYNVFICFLFFLPFLCAVDVLRNTKKKFHLIILALFPIATTILYLLKFINLSINVGQYTYNLTFIVIMGVLCIIQYIYYLLFIEKKRILALIYPLISIVVCDFLSKIVYSSIASFNQINDIYDYSPIKYFYGFTLLIWMLVPLINNMNLKKKRQYSSLTRFVFQTLLYAIGLIIISFPYLFVLIEENGFNEGISIITMVLIVFLLIIAILLTYELLVNHEQEIDKEDKIKNHLNDYYNRQIRVDEDELIKIKHDVNNFLQVVKLNDDKLYQELKERVGTSNQFNFTKDEMLNKILVLKINEMHEAGISYEYEIDVQGSLLMSDIDKISLFSNIIDNAIEGAKNSLEKSIHIEIFYRDDYLNIHVINSADKLKKKTDTKYHGKGHIIVNDIINKYGGNLNTYYANKKYQINIDLDLLNK